MPRATTGSKVKARTLQVLEALLRYANHEVEMSADIPGLHCRWQDSPQTTLVVQTTLRSLLELNQRVFPDQPLTKPQVREALRRLQDFLQVLEDYRVHQRGSEDWHFTLHLTSQETARVIAAAAAQWDSLKAPELASEMPNSGAAESPPLPGLCRGAPFQVPPLPHYFVDRPEHLSAVKTYLLKNAPQRPGTLVVSAIQGLGGIGKSVLAAAIAHDPTVQSRFGDGVLWSTLGQQPDILACLSGWIQELGDHSYKPTTTSSASAHLRTLLHDRRMLLVVDDVWDPSHAEPFRVGGSDCCILVTTREARIPGALRYELDVMTPEQSLALLKQSIQEELSDTAVQEALALAKAVAYLPLALELAAAQIEDGATWAELLDALEQEIADLDVLDIQGYGFQSQTSRQRNLSLLASFNLSLKRLPPEQLHQFAWLGVLPEDVTITETMAATLWNLRPAQARTLLRFLKGRALLLSSGRQADQRVGYRLHDLMHDVARHLLTGAPEPKQPGMLSGLGITLREAHQQFINRYRPKLQNGQWHTIPSDGYIHTHLTWHLEQAGLTDEIHQLLQEENADSKNGWYIACRDLGQTASFINDVGRAWRLADELFVRNRPQALALQFRYALIKGSLNTLAGNLPPELIAVLVSQGIWQPAQGLAHLQQIAKPWRQVYAFEVLLPHLPDSLLGEAHQIAHWMTDRVCRAEALASLSLRMPELQEEATCLLSWIHEDYQKAIALGKLATLQPRLWIDVLEIIRVGRPDRDDQGSILREIVDYMPETILDEAWQIATQIPDDHARVIGMAAIARRKPELRKVALEESLQAARAIQNAYRRAWALSALAVLEPDLWLETFSYLQNIDHEFARAWLLRNLAPDLPEQFLAKAIQIGRSIEHEHRRVIALGAFSARVPELWSEVLQDTQVMREADWFVKALVVLSTKVQAVMPLAVDYAQTIGPDYERAIAYSALAVVEPCFWSQAKKATLAVRNACYRGNAFNELATQMPELWPNALEAIQSFQHTNDRAHLLKEVAPKMPQLWSEAVVTLKELWLERQQSQFIYDVILDLPDEYLSEFLNVASRLQDDFERLLALSAMAIRLPEVRPDAIALLHKLQPSSEPPYYAAICAMALGAFTTFGYVDWASVLAAIQDIQGENLQSQVIYNLAMRLPEDQLSDAVVISFDINIDYYRAFALKGLLPRLQLAEIKFSQWCEILQTLAALPREGVLELMPALSDSLLGLGGVSAIEETAYAIRDVGRQW